MNPSPSPDRYSFDKRIQDTQGNIDSEINKAKFTEEQEVAMKKAYIDKVNALQGQVRRSFGKIDVHRDLRSSEWRKWEEEVLGVESKFYILLSDAYKKMKLFKDERADSTKEEVYINGLANFNVKIDEYLNEVSALDEEYEEPKQSKETQEEPSQPLTIKTVFLEWNVPGTNKEVAEKARQASEHYGEAQIRDLAAALSLYESLPTPLKKKLFNTTTPVFRQQVAGQLANGTFETSPLSFLLTEDFDKTEEQVLLERETVLDRINALSQEVQDLEKRTHKQIAQLCKITIEDAANDTIGKIVAWAMNKNGYQNIQKQIVRFVQGLAEEVQSRQSEMNALALQLKQIEYSFNSFDTTTARNEGRKQQEAQLLFRTKIDFGQDIQLPDYQLQLLRPAQQQLFLGKHEDALRTSIDEFNVHIEKNPDLDTLDRIDILKLMNISEVKPDGARFENIDLGFKNPFSQLDVGNATFSRLRPIIGPDGMFDGKLPQKITVLRDLGTLEGGELILVEFPRVEGGLTQTAIAFRDSEGVVRLQDGTVLEDPRQLRPMKISSISDYRQTVYVSPETERFLRSNVGSDSSTRVVLRERIRQTQPIAPFPVGSFRTLDTSQLQTASRRDNGEINLRDANGNLEQTIDAERLRKESTEQGHDVLRSIDQNPLIQGVTQRAGTLQGNMQNMQMMLQTAMSSEANVGDDFVEQLHDYARPMLKVMEDQTTKQQILEAKKLLQSQLWRVKFGNFLGRGMESEIQNRIDALDDYIDVLDDDRMLHGLQSAMEVRSDTWESWLSKDGLIMLGAIVVAVIAIVLLTVFTGGVGLIAISAVGAAAGIAGAEGTKELLYQYHNTLGGASTGQYRYTDGSRVGNYFRDQKLFDPKTGKFVEMEFLGDVAFPYAKEFLVCFATTALALGAGQAAGNALSRLAQSSKSMQALAKNSGIANSIMKRLSGLSDDAVRIPGNMKEFAKISFKEILDELNDELVLEAGVTQGLMRIDKRLAFLATFIVATGKGFKPLSGGQMEYSSEMDSEAVRAWAEDQGHTVAFEKNGVFDVKTFDGQTLVLKPAVVVETNTEQEAEGEPSLEQLLEDGASLIAARRETGASPELTQEAANMMIDQMADMAERAANGDPDATQEYIDKLGKRKAKEIFQKENDELIGEGKEPYSSVEEFVQQKLAKKFTKILANIREGGIGLGKESYIGKSIRDLHKLMPGVDMEVKQGLNRQLHEAAMRNNTVWKQYASNNELDVSNLEQYMDWFMSPDQTIEGGRPDVSNHAETTFAGIDSAQINSEGANTRLDATIVALSSIEGEFSRAAVEQALDNVTDPVDRTVLLETATMLENITPKAGEQSLMPVERWKIMEFSARYLQDFRAANFDTSPQQALDLIANNALNLAHQNIMDHMTLVGSSHGSLHVLHGNSTMLLNICDQLNFTPRMRVLAMQAMFDHDMGYTKRTLVGSTGKEGVFDASKDHPLESTLRIEASRDQYIAIFGKEGYETIRNAVLDHSDPLGEGQYEGDTTKLRLMVDETASESERVEAAVACVDCLATVSNLKASPLIRDNPDVFATMTRIQQIWDQARAEGKTKGNAPEDMITDPELKAEADAIRHGLIDRIKAMDETQLSPEAQEAYVTSLESTMTWSDFMGSFAISLNMQMIGASVSPDLRIDQQGGVHVEFSIDPDGQALIAETMTEKATAKISEAGVLKAADDFGGLTGDSKTKLSEFTKNSRNLRSSNANERIRAQAYFEQNGGTIELTTNSNLVIDLTVGQNPEYTQMREASTAAMRIDTIRQEAKSRLNSLLTTGTVHIEGVNGQVEISSVEDYNKYIHDSLDSTKNDLPKDFVMPSMNDYQKFISYEVAIYEVSRATQKQTKAEARKTWQEFYGRMSRGGSASPVTSLRRAA